MTRRQWGSELTDVLNVEAVLIIEDSLIPWAELDTVRCPDGSVVLIEEALIWLVCAVLRTLIPLFRGGMGWSARVRKTTCWNSRKQGDTKQFCIKAGNPLDQAVAKYFRWLSLAGGPDMAYRVSTVKFLLMLFWELDSSGTLNAKLALKGHGGVAFWRMDILSKFHANLPSTFWDLVNTADTWAWSYHKGTLVD